MNLNLFGDDDDAQTSSGFSANLKMETYNSVVVTFNSIVANADDTKAKAKDNNTTGTPRPTKNKGCTSSNDPFFSESDDSAESGESGGSGKL